MYLRCHGRRANCKQYVLLLLHFTARHILSGNQEKGLGLGVNCQNTSALDMKHFDGREWRIC